jgi:SAM-dependent methyltransferase
MDSKSIIAAQRKAYRANFLLHGDSPRGIHVSSFVTQHVRYENLLRQILPHFSPCTDLHDVGAGVGGLYAFLKLKGLDQRVKYSGTEIVQEMIDAARAKYPELNLANRDFLDRDIEDKYDFVVLSGALNLLGGVDERAWKAMCLALIEKMFAHARRAIAFNFLTSYRTFSDPKLYYLNPTEIFDFATNRLSRFVSLDAAYPLYECTVTVFKKDYVSGLHEDPELMKYFG